MNNIDHLGRVVFSTDGTLIGVAGADRTIRVFPVDVDAWARHGCPEFPPGYGVSPSGTAGVPG